MKDCETIQVFLSCCVSPQEVPTSRNWSFILLHGSPGGFHIIGAQYSAIILPSSCIMSSYIGLIKYSFFNKVIVSQIMCFPQPESRKAGGSCWRPHRWCPLLVLNWTSIFCCQTCPTETSRENHVKMGDEGVLFLLFKRRGALLGFWSIFQQVDFAGYWSDRSQGVGGLTPLCS